LFLLSDVPLLLRKWLVRGMRVRRKGVAFPAPKLTDLYREASTSTHEPTGNPENGTFANAAPTERCRFRAKVYGFVTTTPACQLMDRPETPNTARSRMRVRRKGVISAPKLTDLYRDASMSTYEQDGNPANGTSANVVRRKGAVSAPKLTDFVPRCQHVNS